MSTTLWRAGAGAASIFVPLAITFRLVEFGPVDCVIQKHGGGGGNHDGRATGDLERWLVGGLSGISSLSTVFLVNFMYFFKRLVFFEDELHSEDS